MPDRIIQAITGHKTRSMLDRYDTVTIDELIKWTKILGTNPGTVENVGAVDEPRAVEMNGGPTQSLT